MPRAIWSGSVAFGLVSVPVRMTSAVSEHALHFHYVFGAQAVADFANAAFVRVRGSS
ncbi:MAG: hypothetical protein ACRDNI_01050 [Gaiellaceae bacterium]